jgi:Plasmid pRiA4b ORF-3-like protein
LRAQIAADLHGCGWLALAMSSTHIGMYGDPFVNLAGTADEGAVRVRDVLTPVGNISYTYDLGACWEHEIALEQTLPRDRGLDYPVCVAYKGDSPVEYWAGDDPGELEPFDLAEVNGKLAALGEAEE